MIFIPSLLKIDLAIQKLIGGGDRHTESVESISNISTAQSICDECHSRHN
jgi:hypothetical protein